MKRAGGVFSGSSARTAILLSVLMIVKAAAGFLSQLVIVYEFGAGAWTDAFFLGMSVPQLLGDFLIGGALLYAIVPVSFEAREKCGERAQAHFHFKVLVGAIAVASVVAIAFYGVAPHVIPLLGHGMAPETIRDAILMARLFSPIIIFWAVSFVGAGLFWVYKRYYESVAVGFVYSAVLIFFCVCLKNPLGDLRLPLGVLTGVLMQVLLTVGLLSGLEAFAFSSETHFSAGRKKVLKIMAPSVVSALAVAFLPLQQRYLASFLGKGAISCFDYANALAAVPAFFVLNTINTLFYSKMSEYAAKAQTAESSVLLGRVLYFVLLVTIPLSVFSIFLGEPIVVLLLQRGAFTASDAERTRTVLSFAFVGLFAQASNQLLSRSYYAEQKPWVIVQANLVTLVITASLAPILFSWLGLGGLGMSVAVAAIAQMVFFFVRKSKALVRIPGVVLLKAAVKILGLSGLAGIPVLILAKSVFPKILLASVFLKALFVLFSMGVGFFLFAILMLWRRDENLAGLFRFISRRGILRQRKPMEEKSLTPDPDKGKICVFLVLDDLMVGGSERSLLRWLGEVDRSRFRFHLVTLFGLGDLAEAFRQQGFEIEHLDIKQNGFWKGFLKAKQLVDQENPDLVLCLREGARAICPFVFRVLGVRGIASRWGGIEFKQSLRLYLLEHLQINFMDTFHVVGRSVGDLLKREYGIEKVEVLYAGVDQQSASNAEKHKSVAAPLEIISVGNLKWEKRHLDQIEIARRLKKEGVRFHLTIVGEGALRRKIEHAIQASGLGECVTLAGKSLEVPTLLSRADVFLFTSVSEGFPNAVLEAVAAGLPCVVYELPFVNEIDPKRKWLKVVPSGDLNAAVRSLAEMGRETETNAAGSEADRAELLSGFLVSDKVRQWEESLSKLANKDSLENLAEAK